MSVLDEINCAKPAGDNIPARGAEMPGRRSRAGRRSGVWRLRNSNVPAGGVDGDVAGVAAEPNDSKALAIWAWIRLAYGLKDDLDGSVWSRAFPCLHLDLRLVGIKEGFNIWIADRAV